MVDQSLLLADNAKRGAAWCQAHSDLVDGWLTHLLEAAAGPSGDGVALVAVGGYGRSELCPQSDIDVMLLHDGNRDVAALADRIWYPIWDAGLKLGHSVATVREAMEIAADTLDTATALLSARHVAGDPKLTDQLAAAGRDYWRKRAKRLLTELGTTVALRHETSGEVAFLLEPDLKEGRGGLRDVHALRWAEAAHRVILDDDAAPLDDAYAVLLDTRVELQRLTGRPSNVLSLQDQDAVAVAVGAEDGDDLMHRIADAARLIAWTSDDTWRRIRLELRGPLGRVGRRSRALEHGLVLRDGEIHIADDADAGDAALALRAAGAAAAQRSVIARSSLERLAAAISPPLEPWPDSIRQLFADLLLAGAPAIPVVESLDSRGIWTTFLPEWEGIRAKPQRNPYHRFTVDRHLLEAAATVARLANRVDRPDLLVTGALLHDIGKGSAGDHTEVGMKIVDTMARRMGFDDGGVATLVWMVEHHLLLADVAMRRDLDDPATARRVADAVGTASRLNLLAALTEADSLATSPAAWGPAKAQLVEALVDRTLDALGAGNGATAAAPVFPTASQLERLRVPGTHLDSGGDTLTVMTDDRPGTFSRVAGVLALHGLDVLSAAAYSSDSGRALSEFKVTSTMRSDIRWDRVVGDLEKALEGRLALHARLAERARTYARTKRPPAAAPSVRFDNAASDDASVIDVHAVDSVGVLYRITRALADLDLDIRSARVQTLGHQVVDAFYVRDRRGGKITDPQLRAEIERALLHSLAE